MRNVHPDLLEGDALVARTQGDALQLADLVREHGPETLNRLLDAWGTEHTRRVTIALAAAVNPGGRIRDLWGWLDGPILPTSTTIPTGSLWRGPCLERTERLQAVAALYRAGYTQPEIATRLHTSPRQVSRDLADWRKTQQPQQETAA